MTNLTKLRRDEMINFLKELKQAHNDDESIRAFNKIENALTEKKFGLVFEEHTEEVDDRLLNEIPIFCADETRKICKDKNLPYNFIIEGDNLQALYLIEKTHKGRVDCIYIDPPYNKGDKSWKYNNDYVDKKDIFKHSKWLSMMKNRLIIAKRLLNPENSVLICTIDENEFIHLGALLEELFPTAKIQMITDVINPRGTNRDNEFSRVEEYIYVCRIGNAKIRKSENNMLGNTDEVGKSRVWYAFNRGNNPRSSANNQFFPIYIDENTKRIIEIGEPMGLDYHPKDFPSKKGLISVFPINNRGEESIWRAVPETVREWVDKGYVKVSKYDDTNNRWTLSYIPSGMQQRIESGQIFVGGKLSDGSLDINQIDSKKEIVSPRTVWVQKQHNATDYGASIIKKIIPGHDFQYPKSLYSVRDNLWFFIGDKKDAIVVDFFAGSGTTLHAVNLLNAEDGGNRKCILVTNNELSEDEAKRLTEEGYKPGDEEWEKLGIAKYVTWPRTYCSINGVDINGNPLKGDYGVKIDSYVQDTDSKIISKSTGRPTRRKLFKKKKIEVYPNLSKIKKSDGFDANVKYFKCDWTPRKPQDYLLSNVLLLHIKEMIELEHHIEIDNKKYVVILNKEDFNDYILNEEIYSKIENVWVNQNIIFTSEELKLLDEKEFKYIPREYFGQELKEAAE